MSIELAFVNKEISDLEAKWMDISAQIEEILK
jgi:hypothetical protein